MNLKFSILLSLLFFFSCSNAPENASSEAPPDSPTSTTNSEFVSPSVLFGDLLKDVQMARVFPDGKTFVDCTPKKEVSEILKVYSKLKDRPDFDLKKFVLANFDEPKEYVSDFQFDSTKNVTEHINSLWSVLTKDFEGNDSGSLIPLPNSHMVQGGNSREVYYWDSYFIMLGLQAAGKTDLIEKILDNFAYLTDKTGFIPGSNRTYYLGRSQPPFFACMVELLAEIKGEEVYKKYLPTMTKEYEFWMEGIEKLSRENRFHRRLVRLADGTILNRYWDDFDGPRPEAYREDVKIAKESGRPAAEVYRDIRAACESGWDFSSRWLADGRNMTSIRTTQIIPVDLNCLLYNLEMTLSKAEDLNGDSEKSEFYKQRADQRKEAVLGWLYHGPAGFFMDFDIPNGEPTYIPSLAGVFPLFFKMAPERYALPVAQNIEEDFVRPGGLITTVHHTKQPWDAPNGWAPLHWITIQALRNYGHDDLANRIKMNWINLNQKVFRETGKLVEKYNVQDIEAESGGGEYAFRDGFGWSNGVLLKLMTEEE